MVKGNDKHGGIQELTPGSMGISDLRFRQVPRRAHGEIVHLGKQYTAEAVLDRSADYGIQNCESTNFVCGNSEILSNDGR
jgi:hypothetical protein